MPRSDERFVTGAVRLQVFSETVKEVVAAAQQAMPPAGECCVPPLGDSHPVAPGASGAGQSAERTAQITRSHACVVFSANTSPASLPARSPVNAVQAVSHGIDVDKQKVTTAEFSSFFLS